MRIHGKILVPRPISYGMHRHPERANNLFVLKSNLSHKLQYWINEPFRRYAPCGAGVPPFPFFPLLHLLPHLLLFFTFTFYSTFLLHMQAGAPGKTKKCWLIVFVIFCDRPPVNKLFVQFYLCVRKWWLKREKMTSVAYLVLFVWSIVSICMYWPH